MLNKYDILSPECMYHVYNRANGSENLFLSTENYRYFLQQYQKHISPIADTFCYCLMPSHFHFLIRIKTEEELKAAEAFPKFETLEKLSKQPSNFLEKQLSKRFSNLFSSYTQAFNKQQKRMGSLFMKNYKRIKVNDRAYLFKLIHYIHYNPVESNLCLTPGEWPHSSYAQILSVEPSFLKRKELLKWFGDKENFLYTHQQGVQSVSHPV